MIRSLAQFREAVLATSIGFEGAITLALSPSEGEREARERDLFSEIEAWRRRRSERPNFGWVTEAWREDLGKAANFERALKKSSDSIRNFLAGSCGFCGVV